MSARPAAAGRPSSAARVSTTRLHAAQRWESDDADDDDLEGVIQDDDDDEFEEGEFGDDAEAMERLLRQQRLMDDDGTSRKRAAIFRPTSAPVSRSKTQASAGKAAMQRQDSQRHRATVSIAYLKQAAEKKKKRDRAFAQELMREENEYKKKIQQKIEQANKMTAALGSQRTFGMAPDRDGLHMVRVIDPNSNDRVISQWQTDGSLTRVLREFERLASVQIGHLANTAAHRRESVSTPTLAVPPNMSSTFGGSMNTSNASQSSTQTAAAAADTRTSKLRIHGIRTSRAESTRETAVDVAPAMMATPSRKRQSGKATDRSLVQEELKSVLANTIELTKVLQDQLHELKLKGWNFSSRTGLNTQTSSV
ncbi:hypothetical protein PINS_up015076 [Pythium insidiosum]|nr:hypothetical protein PINS_up015076 [Pythium insidiosum]